MHMLCRLVLNVCLILDLTLWIECHFSKHLTGISSDKNQSWVMAVLGLGCWYLMLISSVLNSLI